MTKIDIFSGFLGAGKTTLIKKLLKEAYAGEKVVLIENEFGEIGIDGGFLKESGIEITEMNSGCICCSLVGDFSRSLAEVLKRFHPDRILIEPSGVGKLSDVIRAVQDVHAEDAMLNGFTTVVDAKKCKMYMKNFGEFFGDQIEHAGAIILSHTEGLADEKVAAAVALVREHNTEAAVVTTPWGMLDGKQILSAIEKTNTLQDELSRLEEHAHHHHHHDHDEDCCFHHDHDHEHEHEHHNHDEECCCHHDHEHHHDHDEGCCCHHEHEHEHHHDHDEECDCHEHEHHHHDHEHEHHHDHDHGEACTCGCHDHRHHHHADEVFDSLGRETTRKYTEAEIEKALLAFANGTEYGMVLRAKGILPAADGQWIHFDYVPGEPDIRLGGADVIGRFCVIGSGLDKAAILALFGLEEA